MKLQDLLVRRLNIPLATTGVAVVATSLIGGSAYAASTADFSQVVGVGTLTTDIRDASRVSVSSPAVTMSAVTFSFNCQAGATASTGTFGSNSQRIYVDNPDSADNGWTLTLAATDGSTAGWSNSGDTQTFDYNDASGSTAGCSDSGDTDSVAGQMTINPSAATLTTDYSGSSTTGISLGSSAAYAEGSVDSITLVTAGSTSADVWRGYVTGIGVSQTLPAEQAADTYTLNLTLTVASS